MSQTKSDPASAPNMTFLSLSALGVVFGDIGTSPLYTFKTVLALTDGTLNAHTILGCLSLIIWTLIIVTTVKYVGFAMRIDNNGEGGVLALMSLLGVKLRPRPVIVAAGLIGAALIYGDGAITPAISVLSALEGLNIITPHLTPYILPLTVLILIALFIFQYKGTTRIGTAFGPVMALWFLCIGFLGLAGITRHPSVLLALNPFYGLHYLLTNGMTGFLVLGGVFLCVTGAEALYADMGHFGARPIRFAWLWLAFPCLTLNYAGQAALILDGVSIENNTFYMLCPPALLVPFVVLATVATIIASQSIITGAFSMTRQAIQLGWLPPLAIKQTSAEGYGQIYVGIVNWLMMIVTICLALAFQKSDNLASAYGIAVSATMLMTSVLLFIAMRDIWQWSLLKAAAVAGIFIIVDTAFFTANLTKIFAGGYVPLVLAGLVYSIMYAWHKGAEIVVARLKEATIPIADFLAQTARDEVPRIEGLGVFLTRTKDDVPPVMIWHVRQNHVLYKQLLILDVDTLSVPWVADADKLAMEQMAPDVWRATARYGFMERPDIPTLLKQSPAKGCKMDFADVTYYIGHETVIASNNEPAMSGWAEAVFAFMQRNSLHLSDYFQLPQDNVVEIGRQIAI
jgi:KUP system potassium uptake protein